MAARAGRAGPAPNLSGALSRASAALFSARAVSVEQPPATIYFHSSPIRLLLQLLFQDMTPDAASCFLVVAALALARAALVNFMPCVFPVLSLKALQLTRTHKKR